MVLQCDQEPAGQRLRTRNTVRSDHRTSELQENAAHSETGRVLVYGSSHPVTHRKPESKARTRTSHNSRRWQRLGYNISEQPAIRQCALDPGLGEV